METGGYQALDRLRLEKALARNASSFTLAGLYRGIGDYDKAITSLQKAIDEPVRAVMLMFLRTFPGWAPLRQDPRFTAVLQQIGLDPVRLLRSF